MMKLRLLIAIFLLSGTTYTMIGQDNIFNEVLEVNLRNMNEIVTDGEVIGYYLFYKKEKINRKETAYELVFLDADLEKLSSSSIIGSKRLAVLEGVYNGNALMVKFIEPKKKTLIYRLFDNNSKEIYKKEVEIEKLELRTIAGMQGKDYDMYAPSLIEAGSKGFVDVGYLKKKYQIRYFDNESSSKYWDYSPSEGKKHQTATLVYGNDNNVVISVIQRKSMMSTKGDYFLTSLSTEDGSIVEEIATTQGQDNYMMLTGSKAEDGTTKLFGSYYKKGENIVKADPAGIISVEFDKSGVFGANQKVSLSQIEKQGVQSKKGKSIQLADNGTAETDENEVEEKKEEKKSKRKKKKKKKKKKSKDADKERWDGLGNLFIHNIEQLENGEVVMVGEYFKKKMDAGAILSRGLGSGSSMTKMTINDLVILRLSPELEILDVQNIEKNADKCWLPNGALYYDTNMLGYFVKYIDGFSYEFAQQSKEGDNVLSIVFRDEGKDKKEGPSIRILNIVNNEYIEDKISLKTEASSLRVLKAKPGHVLITEYYKKKKKLDMRLEKINF